LLTFPYFRCSKSDGCRHNGEAIKTGITSRIIDMVLQITVFYCSVQIEFLGAELPNGGKSVVNAQSLLTIYE
jgi:hypothetical protein